MLDNSVTARRIVMGGIGTRTDLRPRSHRGCRPAPPRSPTDQGRADPRSSHEAALSRNRCREPRLASTSSGWSRAGDDRVSASSTPCGNPARWPVGSTCRRQLAGRTTGCHRSRRGSTRTLRRRRTRCSAWNRSMSALDNPVSSIRSACGMLRNCSSRSASRPSWASSVDRLSGQNQAAVNRLPEGEVAEQRKRGRVGPLQVVEDQDQRSHPESRSQDTIWNRSSIERFAVHDVDGLADRAAKATPGSTCSTSSDDRR